LLWGTGIQDITNAHTTRPWAVTTSLHTRTKDWIPSSLHGTRPLALESSDDEQGVEEQQAHAPHESTSWSRSKAKGASSNRLKEKFLHHLAEMLARKKGAMFVSSASSVEEAEKATIYVSRNDGLSEYDQTFLRSFSSCAADIKKG
jgi:hypothetical protein